MTNLSTRITRVWGEGVLLFFNVSVSPLPDDVYYDLHSERLARYDPPSPTPTSPVPHEGLRGDSVHESTTTTTTTTTQRTPKMGEIQMEKLGEPSKEI
jgi:hypothetical protein